MTMDILHGYPDRHRDRPGTDHAGRVAAARLGRRQRPRPKLKNEKEEERIVNLIMRFMNEVLVTFEVAPKEFEPLFCEHEHEGQTLIDAEAWCWGFWEGMELRPGSWDADLGIGRGRADAADLPAGRRRDRGRRTAAGGRPGQGAQAGAGDRSEPAGDPPFWVPLRKAGGRRPSSATSRRSAATTTALAAAARSTRSAAALETA